MTFTPDNAVVWTEIPVRDIDRGIAFYSQVFDFEMTKDESGPNPMAMFPVKDLATGTAGHIYPGNPAAPGTGPTIHVHVPDSLEPTADRFEKAGGTIKGDAISMPFGRFQYGEDPDGNSIGLFEPAKG